MERDFPLAVKRACESALQGRGHRHGCGGTHRNWPDHFLGFSHSLQERYRSHYVIRCFELSSEDRWPSQGLRFAPPHSEFQASALSQTDPIGPCCLPHGAPACRIGFGIPSRKGTNNDCVGNFEWGYGCDFRWNGSGYHARSTPCPSFHGWSLPTACNWSGSRSMFGYSSGAYDSFRSLSIRFGCRDDGNPNH